MNVFQTAPTGPILEQRGEEAAAAESQRIPTKKRVHDAEPSGLPQRRQVEYKVQFYRKFNKGEHRNGA